MSAPILPSAFTTSASAGQPVSCRAAMIGFVAGTRIATPMGYVAVERLSEGHLVLTADGRHARLAGVTHRHVEQVTSETAPVRFAIGKLDNMRPLRVAQGHCTRIEGWRAELMFEAPAVLAPAIAFVDDADVVVETDAGPVTYVNLMFDGHEIVLAENVACQTICPDADADHRGRSAARGRGGAMHARIGTPSISAMEARLLLAA